MPEKTIKTKLGTVFNPKELERLSKDEIIGFINDERIVSYMALSRQEATSRLSDQELLDAVDRIFIRQEKGYISPSCIFVNQDCKRIPEGTMAKLKEIPKPEQLNSSELKSRYRFPRRGTIAELAWHVIWEGGDRILLEMMDLLIQDKVTDDEAMKMAKRVEKYRRT